MFNNFREPSPKRVTLRVYLAEWYNAIVAIIEEPGGFQMATEETPKKKRGAKGGIKHQPGRDHDRKSAVNKKKRFARKASKKRQMESNDARKAWQAWDALADDVKRLLGPAAQPKMPRPTDD